MRLLRLSAFLACTIAFVATCFASETFSKKTYNHGSLPSSVVTADVNRDGFPDVIAAYRTPNSGSEHGYLDVMLGGYGGTFTSTAFFSTASDPVKLVAGDFNNDGYPDVMVLEDSGYQLFLSAKNGSLDTQSQVPFGCDGCGGNNLVAVDLNGDHIPDIAFTLCGTTGCALHTEVNDGTGQHFTSGGQSTGIGRVIAHSLVAADFNRDGIDDLAVASDNVVEVFRSLGGGQFTLMQTITPAANSGTYGLAVGDIDNKNGPDLVFLAGPSCIPDCIAASTVYEYLNSGSGILGLKATYTPDSNSTNALSLVDITGDNRLDLITENGELQENNGSLSWAHYSGSGSFSTFSTLLEMGNPVDIVGRDLNLDSRHDLVVADSDGVFTTPGAVILTNTTSSAAICAPPSSINLAAKLCSPGSSTSSGTFTVTAAGNSPTGVRRVELWIDGTKRYQSPDDRLKTTVTLSSGTHKFVIAAYDQFGKKGS